MRATFIFTIAFLGTTWLFDAAFCLTGGHGEFLPAGRASETDTFFQFETGGVLGSTFKTAVFNFWTNWSEEFATFSTSDIAYGTDSVITVDRTVTTFGFESRNRERSLASLAFDRLGLASVKLDVTGSANYDQVSFVEQELDVLSRVWIFSMVNGQSANRSALATFSGFELHREAMPSVTIVPLDSAFCWPGSPLTYATALSRTIFAEVIADGCRCGRKRFFADFASAFFGRMIDFITEHIATVTPPLPTFSAAKSGVLLSPNFLFAVFTLHGWIVLYRVNWSSVCGGK